MIFLRLYASMLLGYPHTKTYERLELQILIGSGRAGQATNV